MTCILYFEHYKRKNCLADELLGLFSDFFRGFFLSTVIPVFDPADSLATPVVPFIYTVPICIYFFVLQPRPTRFRLCRPGSASIQVIPPLKSLERIYACRSCGCFLFTGGHVIKVTDGPTGS